VIDRATLCGIGGYADDVRAGKLVEIVRVGPPSLVTLGEASRHHGPDIDGTTSMTKDDEIRAALEGLRKEYIQELPELLRELGDAVTLARRGESADGMRTAVSRAHALRGTAGSYRFQEISDAAGLIEDGLLGIQSGWLPPEQAWPEIERALSAAHTALDKSAAEG